MVIRVCFIPKKRNKIINYFVTVLRSTVTKQFMNIYLHAIVSLELLESSNHLYCLKFEHNDGYDCL